MVTLSVAYMVRNEMDFMPESLRQVEGFADEIVCVVDSRSNDGTLEMLREKEKSDSRYKVFVRDFDFEVNQKNFARDQCTMDWIHFFDGDEVPSDNYSFIKDAIVELEKEGVEAFSIQGHHFMGNLATEDAWQERHWWAYRCFKNKMEIRFKGRFHAQLDGMNGKKNIAVMKIRIFHFGYARNLVRIMSKYEQDINSLEIHDAVFLGWWREAHLTGSYPVKKYDGPLPKVILDKFKLKYKEDDKNDASGTD